MERKIWTMPIGQEVSISIDEFLRCSDILDEVRDEILKEQPNLIFIVAGKEITSFSTEMALIPLNNIYNSELVYVDLDCIIKNTLIKSQVSKA